MSQNALLVDVLMPYKLRKIADVSQTVFVRSSDGAYTYMHTDTHTHTQAHTHKHSRDKKESEIRCISHKNLCYFYMNSFI